MQVFVVGVFAAEHKKELQQAVERADHSASFFGSFAEAKPWLQRPDPTVPRCVLFDDSAAGVPDFIGWVRSQPHLFALPLFALARQVGEQPFFAAHRAGADDVMPQRDPGALTRRLATLADFDPSQRPPLEQGPAVVALADSAERMRHGRTLRQAGFDVSFAQEGSELLSLLERSPQPRVVCLGDEVGGELGPHIEGLRDLADAGRLPHVLLVPEGWEDSLRQQLRGLDLVETMTRSAPADDLLFVTNELLRARALAERGADDNQRASRRLLWGTLCTFRVAGELQPAYGFTYNISRDGMYIKTYDIPRGDSELWLELRPPDERTAVHLRGRVRWARRPDHARAAATPPGFGLQLDQSACPPGDLECYIAAYEKLCGARSHGSALPRAQAAAR